MRFRRRVVFEDLSRPRVGEKDERRAEATLYPERQRQLSVSRQILAGLAGLSGLSTSHVNRPGDAHTSRGTTQGDKTP